MVKPGQEFKALANCHAKGIFSIPLSVTDKLVQRMFIDTLGQCHTIAPHSHRYDLKLEVIEGYMNHSIWEEHPEGRGAVSMYQFEWESPVLHVNRPGRFNLRDEAPVRYNVMSSELSRGRSVFLEASEIHSLVTEPGTVWIVTEGLDVTEHTVALHRNTTYEPDLTGLYIPIEV